MPRDPSDYHSGGYQPYPNHQQRHGQNRHDHGRSYHGGPAAPPKHPYFSLQEDTLRVNIQTERKGPVITYLSPVQVRLFLEFDHAVNHASPSIRGQMVVPLGYHDFAQTYNSVPRDRFKWRVSELKKFVTKGLEGEPDEERWEWVVPRDSETLRFPAIHTFFLDPKYSVLRKIKVLNSKGLVDEERALMLEKAFDRSSTHLFREKEYFADKKLMRQQQEYTSFDGPSDRHSPPRRGRSSSRRSPSPDRKSYHHRQRSPSPNPYENKSDHGEMEYSGPPPTHAEEPKYHHTPAYLPGALMMAPSKITLTKAPKEKKRASKGKAKAREEFAKDGEDSIMKEVETVAHKPAKSTHKAHSVPTSSTSSNNAIASSSQSVGAKLPVPQTTEEFVKETEEWMANDNLSPIAEPQAVAEANAEDQDADHESCEE
ncbi:hypothetical protein H0H92_003614 [Tricholoma furcatifolium]|nr:hypothetical protein H0H92_003614 [Tricholoma furcatifolium]